MSSPFTLKLQLNGLLCDRCDEALSGVEVRLIGAREDQDTIRRAVDDPKRTLEVLDPKVARDRAERALARGTTDARGALVLTLDAGYAGGPLEIDLSLREAPGQSEPSPRPVTVYLTTFQPSWRGKTERAAAFAYTMPSRLWCALRGLLGAWVICGRVVIEGTDVGVADLRLEAFDTDLFQDDALGSAISGPDGRFRIDYTPADFEKTLLSPVFNVEFTPGPDLYFRTFTAAGDPFFAEPRLSGRSPGRGNVRPCACVTVQVPAQPPAEERPDDPRFRPYWTHIGDFSLSSDLDPVTGRTTTTHDVPALGGVHRRGLGFAGSLPLGGYVPSRYAGLDLRYRFRVEGPGGLNTAVTGATLSPLRVGYRNLFWKRVGDVGTIEPVPIVVGAVASAPPAHAPSDPGPWEPNPVFVVAPDADGFILFDANAIGGGFGVAGALIGLHTPALLPAGADPSVQAGTPVPLALQRQGALFRVIFEVAAVGGAILPAYSRALERLFVSNHGVVGRLGLAELGPTGVGCSPIDETVSVQVTVDHELLESWSVGLSTAAPGLPALSLPAGVGPRGVADTFVMDSSTWPACSYLVTLTTRAALTDGINDAPAQSLAALTFCIDRHP